MKVTARDDIPVVSAKTAELLTAVDLQDDGEIIAEALQVAMLTLIDITGEDPNRPAVARPAKLARRALERIIEILEND